MPLTSENELTTCDVVDVFRQAKLEDWLKGDSQDDSAYRLSSNPLISLWSHSRGYELKFGYRGIAIVTGPAGSIVQFVEV